MDDVVPGVLQRLREADIVALAGLASASLGQDYCRSGYVSATKRQGASLSGVVTIPDTFPATENKDAFAEQGTNGSRASETGVSSVQHFVVEVEILSRNLCDVQCACEKKGTLICTHAAALLYQWVTRSTTFTTSLPSEKTLQTSSGAKASPTPAEQSTPRTQPSSSPRYAPLPPRYQAVNTISETLAQFGLGELRSLAREYGHTQSGLSKQQLLELMIETLHQPEAIRRVVAALEKPQRQLLAAFALAGGSMSDDDLRGLFERFSLDQTGSLQDMLVALQARLLIVRTSFNHSLQQRMHSSTSPLDISWYIPQEVRESLHAALPVTPFNVEVPYGRGNSPALPTIQLAEPQRVLADLLLIARALHGFALEPSEKRPARSNALANRAPVDGSLALPPPDDQPTENMLDFLRQLVPRPTTFLRFAVRQLRLATILYKEDESWQTNLRAIENAAQLLLGPDSLDTLHDLFTYWLNRPSYAELYALAEQGVRVRCRATPLNQPDLRRGELEQENSEARQDLLALLAQVPVNEWINFSAFARFVYRLRPTFLQRRQRLFPTPHWWVEQEEGRPLHPMQLADWLRAEGRYLASLLQGPLHWWGLCDLALSSTSQLLAFRLTPLAHFLFTGHAPSEIRRASPASSTPTLTISTEGHLLIPCQAVNWPLIANLERFAEDKGVQDEKLDYCLTARSLSEAIGQGRDPGELLTMLANFSSEDEKHGLRRLLGDLERRIANYGRVRLYTDVSLLQTADLAVMQQLTATTSLDEHTIRAIGPTLLLLKKPGVERLVEELKRRGQVPLLHEEE